MLLVPNIPMVLWHGQTDWMVERVYKRSPHTHFGHLPNTPYDHNTLLLQTPTTYHNVDPMDHQRRRCCELPVQPRTVDRPKRFGYTGMYIPFLDDVSGATDAGADRQVLGLPSEQRFPSPDPEDRRREDRRARRIETKRKLAGFVPGTSAVNTELVLPPQRPVQLGDEVPLFPAGGGTSVADGACPNGMSPPCKPYTECADYSIKLVSCRWPGRLRLRGTWCR